MSVKFNINRVSQQGSRGAPNTINLKPAKKTIKRFKINGASINNIQTPLYSTYLSPDGGYYFSPDGSSLYQRP